MRLARTAFFIFLNIPLASLYAAHKNSSYVGDVVSERGAVSCVQSDYNGACEVEIRSSADLFVEYVHTPGKVTIIENDGALDKRLAKANQIQLPDVGESFETYEESKPNTQASEETSIGPRILGTELYCNYDLWSIRDCQSARQIKGAIVFKHRGSGKQIITDFTGVVLGPTTRQETQRVSGTNISRINLKIVADFQELMLWVQAIENELL